MDNAIPQLGEIRRIDEIDPHKRGWRRCIWSACEDCGKERWVQLADGKPRRLRCRTCSTKRVGARLHGARHFRWKGGYKDCYGYTVTYVDRGDFFYPMATLKHGKYGGYVMEHRLVMAKHLNRCLLPWEVVHHKNGMKDDNRIENLELLAGRKHHLVDVKTKSYIGKLEAKSDRQQARIAELEQRVTLLEAEAVLSKVSDISKGERRNPFG